MRLLQPMNIVYDNDIGNVGFNSYFRNIEGTASISVNYSEKYKNALYPTEEYLGKYSGKFLNICNIIRKSEGIVVIYSIKQKLKHVIPNSRRSARQSK